MTFWTTSVNIPVLALAGTIFAAFLGLWGLRSVMIANNRQAWINALRDDLAQFFTSVDEIHSAWVNVTGSSKMRDLDNFRKVRSAVLLAHRRILMRLNPKEPLHQGLEKALEPLLSIRGNTVNQKDLAAAVSCAREVLKYEWDVTKYGMFTTPVVGFKNFWKKVWS